MMTKRKHALDPDAPLLYPDHPLPVTRRDFLRQGLVSGMGMTLGGSIFNLFSNPRVAQAALSSDLTTLAGTLSNTCTLGAAGANPVPFICFDLAGGANIAGSNVLVGTQTQMDLLTTAGYSKLGLPGNMIPGGVETTPTSTSNGDFTDSTLGLMFHSDSAFLRGILEKLSDPVARAQINGAIIPARSGNDTGNNPHNPMYGIARAGANGGIVTLIGSRNTESGGNSLAPATMVDPKIRPTKVDRPSDVTGMVDTGNLTGVLSEKDDVVAVMESIVRLSDKKLNNVNTQITADTVIKDLVRCGYLKAADIADRFANVQIDPSKDGAIVDGVDPGFGGTGIFTQAEFNGDGEFRKTASVMKMVVDGHAGAGTITMGGYDYHTGNRSVGETRDLRAGRCMGACLQYAATRGVPLMLYVFSDGSLASNGTLDNSVNGRGKGVWTGDNSSTAASMMMFFDPNAGSRPVVVRDQIGTFRSDASVDTTSSPAANNVNLLAETVILNYLALQGKQGQYPGLFSGLGSNLATLNSYIAFPQIV
ncbi:MAG TPA: general secretion pathway protein GspF [Gammaproteobacteria bacterium]|nr:general secretion pathway protein GspF [Gammaproteobacteria bacterium]